MRTGQIDRRRSLRSGKRPLPLLAAQFDFLDAVAHQVEQAVQVGEFVNGNGGSPFIRSHFLPHGSDHGGFDEFVELVDVLTEFFKRKWQRFRWHCIGGERSCIADSNSASQGCKSPKEAESRPEYTSANTPLCKGHQHRRYRNRSP